MILFEAVFADKAVYGTAGGCNFGLDWFGCGRLCLFRGRLTAEEQNPADEAD